MTEGIKRWYHAIALLSTRFLDIIARSAAVACDSEAAGRRRRDHRSNGIGDGFKQQIAHRRHTRRESMAF